MNLSTLIEQSVDFQKFLNTKMSDVKIETSITDLFFGEKIQPVLNKYWAKEKGVYIFSSISSEEDVWYIGKATKKNFASEVWNKLNNRKPLFKEHWRKDDTETPDDIKDALKRGDFNLTLIKINHKKTEMASLFEVYLQTYFHCNDGKLPILNKKIG